MSAPKNAVPITVRGQTFPTLSACARHFGIPLSALYARVVTMKWDIEKAVSTPVHKRSTSRAAPAPKATVIPDYGHLPEMLLRDRENTGVRRGDWPDGRRVVKAGPHLVVRFGALAPVRFRATPAEMRATDWVLYKPTQLEARADAPAGKPGRPPGARKPPPVLPEPTTEIPAPVEPPPVPEAPEPVKVEPTAPAVPAEVPMLNDPDPEPPITLALFRIKAPAGFELSPGAQPRGAYFGDQYLHYPVGKGHAPLPEVRTWQKDPSTTALFIVRRRHVHTV